MQVDQTGMIISSVPRRCIISSAARAECAQKHTIRYANASRDFEFVATGAFRAIFDRVHVLAVPVTLLLVLAVLLVLLPFTLPALLGTSWCFLVLLLV